MSLPTPTSADSQTFDGTTRSLAESRSALFSDTRQRDHTAPPFALKGLGAGCDGLGDEGVELLGGSVLAGERFEDAFVFHLHERRDPRGDLADDAAPDANGKCLPSRSAFGILLAG